MKVFSRGSFDLCVGFLSAPDPHEDDACSHVPSADSTGATCLHLNTHQSIFTTVPPFCNCSLYVLFDITSLALICTVCCRGKRYLTAGDRLKC